MWRTKGFTRSWNSLATMSEVNRSHSAHYQRYERSDSTQHPILPIEATITMRGIVKETATSGAAVS